MKFAIKKPGPLGLGLLIGTTVWASPLPAWSDLGAPHRPFQAPAHQHAFVTNGAALSPEDFPLRFVTLGLPPRGIDLSTWQTLTQASLQTWSSVSCSYARLEYVGHRDTRDDLQADEIPIVFTDSICLPLDLAAWTIFTPCEGFPARSIFLNAIDYEWSVQPEPLQPLADDGTPRIIDVESAITHELGHVIGLSHPDDRLATMHASYRLDGSMRSLALDDKWGICSLYPDPAAPPECSEDRPCADPQTCQWVDDFQICQEYRAEVGEPCSLDALVCEGRCLLTTDLDGYCTEACETIADCPAGFMCSEVTSAEFSEQRYCVNKVERPPRRGCSATSGPVSHWAALLSALVWLAARLRRFARRKKRA